MAAFGAERAPGGISDLPWSRRPAPHCRRRCSRRCASTSAEVQRYLDASALVKLVIREPESRPLASWLGRRDDIVSCSLARTEVVRAARPSGNGARRRAERLIDEIELIQLDDELLDLAGELEPALRSLDAIHLAAALELGEELEALVTYDARMARGAESLGLRVVAPG